MAEKMPSDVRNNPAYSWLEHAPNRLPVYGIAGCQANPAYTIKMLIL